MQDPADQYQDNRFPVIPSHLAVESGMEDFGSVVRGDRARSFCVRGTFVRFLGIAPKTDLTCIPEVFVDLEAF
jgi:hypothetical protein